MATSDRAQGAAWGARLRAWVEGPLGTDALRNGFARESDDVNVRRQRVLLPIMVVLHAAHMAVFRLSDAARAALSPTLARWHDDVVLVHGATLVFALAGVVAVPFAAKTRLGARLVAPVVAVAYLLHAAAIAGVDQLSMASATVYVAYALGIAVIVCWTPLAAFVAYLVGLGAFVFAIETMQPLPNARLMVLPNGFSITVVAIVLATMLFAVRRRDYAQRVLIDAQRAELAAMNEGLERRVKDQVAEIVERARQIDQLNAQLRVQVRARSTELSIALANLARMRTAGGQLKKGVVLGDRFEIEALVGEGGMGSVYAGVDRTSGAKVAIKVILATSAQELDALHRFLREARAAAQVPHPAVVRMIHVDVSSDGMLFQVQELVEGDSLHDRLADQEPWEAGRVARVAAVLCDALAAAHAAGVIHRDVKPSNMMLTRAPPGLKLLDFGISKVRGLTGSSASAANKIAGTPAYMAPECFDGGKVTDKADVYAVGVLLFRMLTASFPFDAATTREARQLRASVDAPDVRALEPSTPTEVSDLVARCLARDPVARPTARDLARSLTVIADAREAAPLEALARDVLSVPVVARSTEVATKLEGKATPRA